MKTQFRCTVCKKEFIGEPAMSNVCGDFCTTCAKDRNEKSKTVRLQNKLKSRAGAVDTQLCNWCGAEPALLGSRGLICGDCLKMRNKLLACVRFNDTVTKYVARVEAKEAPSKEARAKAIAPVPAPAPTVPAGDRIASLESKFDALIEALGGLTNGNR